MPAHLLIVDSDLSSAERLTRLLSLTVGPCTVVPNTYEALARLADGGFDAVITEFALPGASGIDLLERIGPAVPAIVVTAAYSDPVAARARAAGARAVLSKPVDDAVFTGVVRAVLAVPAGAAGDPDSARLAETAV